MQQLIYVDPERLQYLRAKWPEKPDPQLSDAVRNALSHLPERLNLIVFQRFYEGSTVPQIARSQGISVPEAEAALREAKRVLRSLLADFVFQRWGIGAKKSCIICSHPSRPVIERMLATKPESESWGSFCARLNKAIGQRIHPPNILLTHRKHVTIQSINGEASDAE